MDEIVIVEVERGSPWLDGVETRFREIYQHMADLGLRLPLVDGGERLWRRSIEKTLGRVGVVYAAVSGDHVVGFVQGMLRLTPDHLGGRRVGSLEYVFVDPSLRQSGVGRRLVGALEAWFASRDVHSIELQVLVRNSASREFFARLGYAEELVQMRMRPEDRAAEPTRREPA